MKFKNEVKYFKDFSSFLDEYFLIISSNSRHEEWRNINVKNETKSQRMLTVCWVHLSIGERKEERTGNVWLGARGNVFKNCYIVTYFT